jgi:hypothetical protein
VKRLLVGSWIAIVAVAALLLVADFDPLRDRSMRPPDVACPRLGFNEQRCQAVVAIALQAAHLDADEVVATEIGRPYDPPMSFGELVAVVRFHDAQGRSTEREVWCTGVGGEFRAWCSNDPEIELWMGANHDVPCGGEPPTGCPTRIVPDPEAVAAARSLSIDALEIPLTVGHHDVVLGRALLANGYLDIATFDLADHAPDGVQIPDGVRLEVVTTDPDRPPIGNVYERGIFPGVEEVEAHLIFDVLSAEPGAVLHVRDVVVR